MPLASPQVGRRCPAARSEGSPLGNLPTTLSRWLQPATTSWSSCGRMTIMAVPILRRPSTISLSTGRPPCPLPPLAIPPASRLRTTPTGGSSTPTTSPSGISAPPPTTPARAHYIYPMMEVAPTPFPEIPAKRAPALPTAPSPLTQASTSSASTGSAMVIRTMPSFVSSSAPIPAVHPPSCIFLLPPMPCTISPPGGLTSRNVGTIVVTTGPTPAILSE